MKYILLAGLFMSVLGNNCQDHKEASDSYSGNSELNGFIFIDISDIYHNGGEINLITTENESFLSIQNTKITFNGSEYDLIEEEHVYKKSIGAEAFFAEYGLFVLKCLSKSDTFYEAELNKQKVLIPIDSKYVEFKDLEKYILDTYPVPTELNPLRDKPNETALEVNDYLDHTYTAIEIEGDWVKVKDDKECYAGEQPSVKDIVGWVRWRKDGVFMLKVAYTC